MIQRAAGVVFALMLSPTLLSAQDTVLTVTVPSADVYKGPSNVTPVIGHVSRGTVLSVSRDLGDWVKIAWPDAQDGIGYVRVSMGRVGAPDAGVPATSMTPASSASAAATATTPPPTGASTPERVAPGGQPNVTPISHIVGVGALVAPMSAFGATARVWHKNHVGIQVGFMRDAITSDVATGRVTSIQIEPGMAYAPFDYVRDYIWFRPYVGSAVSVLHQTLSVARPVAMQPVVDNGVGFRVFGGGELTFASMPQFGVSADLGYRRLPTPFFGFKADPLSASFAGHWYLK